MWKWLAVIILILLLISAGVGLYISRNLAQKNDGITTFDECVKAGNPILERYPPVCKSSDKRLFTQDIGNELKYRDEILIEAPRPNQKIDTPLQIKGRARGSWFFEGQFSAELVDGNNISLGTAILKAEGEWMTNEFVSFTGELPFVKKSLTKGILKIRNDNPSGLPENQKELVMPVILN